MPSRDASQLTDTVWKIHFRF